jgi:transcriptional regulator with XRE-family HTH domain
VPPDLTRLVGANLRRVRRRQGLSMSRLSDASGVSRAMLSQVERGKSSPTISLLWRITQALGISLSDLLADGRRRRWVVLRASVATVLTSHDGGFTSRDLFPIEGPRAVEFYELRLSAGSVALAAAPPLGATQSIVVARGTLTVVVAEERLCLEIGDAVLFDADSPIEYANGGDEEVRAYLVMAHGRGRARHGRLLTLDAGARKSIARPPSRSM